MTTYSYHNLDHGLAWGYQQYGFNVVLPVTLVTALFGNGKSQGITPKIPWNPDSEALAKAQLNDAGWYVLSVEELGYHGKTDARGTFFGEKAGYRTAQAEVMGKYDEADNLIQIGMTFRGICGPCESLILDTAGNIINDLQTAFALREFAETYALQAFGDLLDAVAQCGIRHGLSGEEVMVSGHSLGALRSTAWRPKATRRTTGFIPHPITWRLPR